jgi:hypothetical protein
MQKHVQHLYKLKNFATDEINRQIQDESRRVYVNYLIKYVRAIEDKLKEYGADDVQPINHTSDEDLHEFYSMIRDWCKSELGIIRAKIYILQHPGEDADTSNESSDSDSEL